MTTGDRIPIVPPRTDCYGCAEVLGIRPGNASDIYCARELAAAEQTETPDLGIVARAQVLCNNTQRIRGVSQAPMTKPAVESVREWAFGIPPTIPLGGSFRHDVGAAIDILAQAPDDLDKTPSNSVLAGELATLSGRYNADSLQFVRARTLFGMAIDQLDSTQGSEAITSGNYQFATRGIINAAMAEVHLQTARGAIRPADSEERIAQIQYEQTLPYAKALADTANRRLVQIKPNGDLAGALGEVTVFSRYVRNSVQDGIRSDGPVVQFAPAMFDETCVPRIARREDGRRMGGSWDVSVEWGGITPSARALVQVKSVSEAERKSKVPLYEHPINTIVVHGTPDTFYERIRTDIASTLPGNYPLRDFGSDIPDYQMLRRQELPRY